MIKRGRYKEIELIKRANKAAVVGRLMLGEVNTWQEFLNIETVELKKLARKELKGATTDIKNRLTKEISKFNEQNFESTNISTLVELYNEIKKFRGLEMPLKEFEEEFMTLKPKVKKGYPPHSTICISLWGMQFQFPEDELSKDIREGLKIATKASKKLNEFKNLTHKEITKQKLEISKQMRILNFASRNIIISSFNLLEAYLNGVAWDFLQHIDESTLSNRKRNLLNDSSQASIRDKVIKYPKIIANDETWEEDEIISDFLNIIKPFRDSLVHPSPFSAPERFGGYDKLRNLYNIDLKLAINCSELLVKIIAKIHTFINPNEVEIPSWLKELKSSIKKTKRKNSDSIKG